jgi:RimJ/RimL family protein N-acetyltransferase
MEQRHVLPVADPRARSAGGQRLVIRAVTSDDVDKLIALFDDLDADDRHNRFFGHFRPPREFVERIAAADEHGGVGVVAAVLDNDHEEGCLVGEIGYTLLPDGNGELAITVTPRWRRWLGPYLLDMLRASAAARGVPNLVADVLTTDHAVLAMLRHRGAVDVEHTGWRVVRLMIGTSGRTPSWSGPHDRPRVLVEGSGGRWHAEDEARAAGLDVLTCSGPSASRRCPSVAGEPCPLVTGADVVVMADHAPGEEWRQLVESHAHLHPGVPIYFEPSRLEDPTGGSDPTCPVVTAAGAVSLVERLARQQQPR